MSARTFVDTNVLTYAFDDTDSPNQNKALARLAKEKSTGLPVVSPNILAEFYNSLILPREDARGRRVAPIMGAKDAGEAVRLVESHVQVTPLITRTVVREGTRLAQQHGMRTWDAIHLATAVGAGCNRFLTADARFPARPVQGVVVERFVPQRRPGR